MKRTCKRGIALFLAMLLMVPGEMSYAAEAGHQELIQTVSGNGVSAGTEEPALEPETETMQTQQGETEETTESTAEEETVLESEADEDRETVSGNGTSDTISGNEAEESLSDNSVSGNSLSSNSLSENKAREGIRSVELFTDEKGVYQISTPEQLNAFRCIVNYNLADNYDLVSLNGGEITPESLYDSAANAELLNDLDLSSMCGSNLNGNRVLWMPIGITEEGFNGSFEGNGYTISNLYSACGPFYMISGGSVTNLFVSNAEVLIIDTYQFISTGAICADLISGTIKNCKVISGSITARGESTYAGGICGRQEGGIIENCVNEGVSVTTKNVANGDGRSAAGGILGIQSGGTLKDCTNDSTQIASAGAAGGICGAQEGIGAVTKIIDNCVNEADIEFQRTAYAGGICGYRWVEDAGAEINRSIIKNCINRGNLLKMGTNQTFADVVRVGGICGYLTSGTIENCMNTGTLTASGVGGICAEQYRYYDSPPGEIKNCLNLGILDSKYISGISAEYDGSVDEEGTSKDLEFSDNYHFSDESRNAGAGAFGRAHRYHEENDSKDLPGKGERRSETELADGSVAYALQSGNGSGLVWGQELTGSQSGGKDQYPVLTSDPSKRVYKVTFHNQYQSENGGIVSTRYGNTGSGVEIPAAPESQTEGKVFTGWYRDSVPFTEDSVIGTADLTLTAGWGDRITVQPEEVARVENRGVKYYNGKNEIPVTVTLQNGRVFQALAVIPAADAGSYTAYTLGKFASSDPSVGLDQDSTILISKTTQDQEFILTIQKAQANPLSGTLGIARNKAGSYQYVLSGLLPALPEGQSFGTVTYSVQRAENAEADILASVDPASADYPSIAGEVLTVPVKAVDQADQSAVVMIGIESSNFQTAEAALKVTTGYRIRFDSRGGSAVEPQYASEGTLLTRPEPPVKQNVRLAAWYRDEALIREWDFTKDTVTGDMVLYAKWVHPFEEGILVEEIADQAYTGKALRPEIRAWDGNTLLTPGKDYTVSYSSNTKANVDGEGTSLKDSKGNAVQTPSVTIKGKGNYKNKETTKVSFTIFPCSLAGSAAEVAGIEYYNAPKQAGGTVKPNLKVLCGGKTLSSKNDYITAFYRAEKGEELTDQSRVDSIKEAGTYTVVFTGKGNYAGSIRKQIHVAGSTVQLFDKVSVKLEYSTKEYSGEQLTPSVTEVKLSGRRLEETEYTVSYGSNKEAGSGTVTVKAKEGSTAYAGSRTVSFKITGIPISKAKVEGFLSKTVYTGSPVEQGKLILTAAAKAGAGTESETLTENTDYRISYQDQKNTAPGKATLLITGMGRYSGTVKKTFTIAKPNLSDALKSGQLAVTSKTAQQGSVMQNKAGAGLKDIQVLYTPKDNCTGGVMAPIALTEGIDFTVSYRNNTSITPEGASEAGKASASITGIGYYCGKLSNVLTYTITAKELRSEEITVVTAGSLYNAKKQAKGGYQPVIAVYDSGKKLAAGKDYKVAGYSNNTGITEGAEVTIEPGTNGCYTGNRVQRFRIYEKDIKGAKIELSYKTAYYNGDQKKPEVMAVTVQGAEIPKEQYTVSYGENKKVGSASVTVTGEGEYGGSKTVKFVILPKWLRNLLD